MKEYIEEYRKLEPSFGLNKDRLKKFPENMHRTS